MSNNLTRYAKEQQLDPNEAGEVVLAAAESGSEIGNMTNPAGLEAIGILSADTKEQVIQKLKAAIESEESINVYFGEKMPDVPDLVAIFKIEINGVLQWLGVTNE